VQDREKRTFKYLLEASRSSRGATENYQVRTRTRSLLGLGLVASTLFWFIAFRLVSLPVLIVAWVLFFKRSNAKHIRPSLAALGAFVLLTFSPIDVLPFPRGWPPRIVPLVMGLPTHETVARAKRGEVILGGCIATGFESKYYLVW
jgi:hypothetical protein